MDWRFNTIWFDQIDELNFYQGNLKEEEFDIEKFKNVEYSILWHLKIKQQSFDKLPKSQNLKYLKLNWANLKELNGLTKFPNLKRLETHYCTKLESLEGIKNVDKLEYLHINQSKKLQLGEQILKLADIKVLCLNGCGEIQNLDFLSKFKKLIDFRFVDTKIQSGDLRPLIEHPTIRTVSFLNKRHYNMKDEQVEKILNEKFKEDYKDKVYKGDFVTYKYQTYER